MKNPRSDKKRSVASKSITHQRQVARTAKYGSVLRATFAASAR